MSGPMLRTLATLALVALIARPAAAQGNFEVIHGPQKDDGRFNIYVLGDGYRQHELPKYRATCKQLFTQLFQQEPYAAHKDLFRVVRIDVASTDSGMSLEGTYVARTALGLGVWRGDKPNDWLYWFPRGQLGQRLEAIRLLIRWTTGEDYPGINNGFTRNRDMVLAISNWDHVSWGTSIMAGFSAMTASPASQPQLLMHELGHGLAQLEDEYSYKDTAAPTGIREPFSANATREKNRAHPKWERWIGRGRIGVYEGGMTYASGILRPHPDDVMNSTDEGTVKPYCLVCQERIVTRLYEGVSLIAARAPASDSVSLRPGFGRQVFRVTVRQDPGTVLDVSWKLVEYGWFFQNATWAKSTRSYPASDGAGRVYEYEYTGSLGIGRYGVECHARDDTPLDGVPWDFPTTYGYNSQAVAIWTIHVTAR